MQTEMTCIRSVNFNLVYTHHVYIVYIHTYCTYIHTYTHTHIHTHIHTYIHTHTCIHTCIHVCVCVYVCMCVCACACVRVCVHVCMYMYIRTCTHTLVSLSCNRVIMKIWISWTLMVIISSHYQLRYSMS